MSHYAQIDQNNIVIQIIVAEEEFILSGAVGDPASWIQTSYNTRMGVHYGPNREPDGGIALRANYAGEGYIYHPTEDIFSPPKPFDSFQLDATTGFWVPPVAYPQDGENYSWDEATLNWVPYTGDPLEWKFPAGMLPP